MTNKTWNGIGSFRNLYDFLFSCIDTSILITSTQPCISLSQIPLLKFKISVRLCPELRFAF